MQSIQALGVPAAGFTADVQDYKTVANSVGESAARLGKLDIVVSGAAGNFIARQTSYLQMDSRWWWI